jgi:hypothetical protein
MRKLIRSQLIKMLVVIGGIAGVVVFAWDFVYTGLQAKLVLNGGIWLVFLFGVAMAFATVLRLRNEETAFKALTEAYEDIKANGTRGRSDPYWRHYRCLQPGTVFERPRLLGHVFEIVYEEMLRTKNLRVNVGTMQTLVHGIEEKLAEERSLVTYLSGLLVFLGLIGAFIGLIQMVASVGGIVGSLGGGTAPGADTSAMFGKLIGELQGPLKGMSVGFSSSLFGLAGSLALGLIGRFAAQAGTVLKSEFEGWISNVVQIEDREDEAPRATLAGAAVDPQAARDIGVALTAVSKSVATSQKSFERVAELLERMTAEQATQTEAMRRQAEQVERLIAHQGEMKDHMARSVAHASALTAGKAELIEVGKGLRQETAAGFARLSGAIDTLQRSQEAGFSRISIQPIIPPTDLSPVISAIEKGLAPLSDRPFPIAEGAAVAPRDDAAVIAEVRKVADALGADMNQGLGHVAEAIESSFTAYADLVRTVEARMAASERSIAEARAAGLGAAAHPATPNVERRAEPEAEPVDHEAMMRRLYDRIAQQYHQATGTNG